jgi:hypothetical protein
MTLGKMIESLKSMPESKEIKGIGTLHSYRGYYSDLAFDHEAGKKPVVEVLNMCLDAMGKVFQGYKGGDYVMGELTPLWMAEYGCCGERIMAINEDGTIETASEDD